MYIEFLNKNVSFLVAATGSNFVLKYCGTFVEENENSIILNNATIMLVPGNMKVDKNIDRIVIDKKFVISCNIDK